MGNAFLTSPPVLLLEHPRPPDPSRFQEVVNAPLSACLFSPYLVSLLRSKGIGVELLDSNLLGLSMQETLKELTRRLAEVAPRGRHPGLPLLGVHLVYLWEKTEEVFDLLSKIKSLNPRVHINLYGYYPTFAFRKILERFPFVDSVTLGEPEYPFMELAQALVDSKETPDLSHIKGIAWRNSHCERSEAISQWDCFGTTSLAMATKVEPDSLPFPDRSLLPLYQEKGLATYILGSRGCYGRCTFCYVSPFYGGWRGRSPQNIFEELKDLYENGVRYFYFADANFFGPGRAGREQAKELADIILKEGLNIRFGMECRANDLEEDSLSRLVEAGLREVFLGIESACVSTLKRFRKDTSQEVNRRAIGLLRHFGIEPNLGFIMFEPYTSLKDIRTNLEFLKDTRLLRSPAITVHLLSHKQTLFMGTADYHRFSKDGQPGHPYEAHYDLEDPGVKSFYEVVSRLCHGVLSILTPEEAKPCCVPHSDNACLLKINKVLVDTYEEILCLYERGDGQKRASIISKTALEVCRGVLQYAPTVGVP